MSKLLFSIQNKQKGPIKAYYLTTAWTVRPLPPSNIIIIISVYNPKIIQTINTDISCE